MSYSLATLKNIYHSKFLCGESLCKPLKKYHNFFSEKYGEGSNLNKSMHAIKRIVSCVFAYPFFGLLTGIGMGIKTMHYYLVKKEA